MPTTEERQRTITVVSVIVTRDRAGHGVRGASTRAPSAPGSARRSARRAGSTPRWRSRASRAATTSSWPPSAAATTRSRWNPCREIHYVVNPDGSPPDWEALVEDGIDEVEDRTGLAFRYDGTTDDRGFDDRFAPNGEPLPVLIGWADDEEVPDLEGDVAGIGGATYAEAGGRRAYVTGMVVLDVDTYDSSPPSRTPTPSSSRCCCTSSATWSASRTSTTAARSCTPTASPAPPTAPATSTAWPASAPAAAGDRQVTEGAGSGVVLLDDTVAHLPVVRR